MSTIFSDSRKNTMKREVSGTTRMAPPTSSAYSGYIYTSEMTVSHNLGYTPIFRVEYEPFGDGIIWSDLAGRIDRFASNPNSLAQQGPGLIYWLDSTAPYDLHIQLFYKDATLTRTIPVYWVLYR